MLRRALVRAAAAHRSAPKRGFAPHGLEPAAHPTRNWGHAPGMPAGGAKIPRISASKGSVDDKRVIQGRERTISRRHGGIGASHGQRSMCSSCAQERHGDASPVEGEGGLQNRPGGAVMGVNELLDLAKDGGILGGVREAYERGSDAVTLAFAQGRNLDTGIFTSYLSLCIHAHANSNKATAVRGHSTSNHNHNHNHNHNNNVVHGLRVQNDNALSEAIRGIHTQMQDFGVVPGGEWFRRAVYGALDGCDAGCALQMTHVALATGHSKDAQSWFGLVLREACVETGDGRAAMLLIQDLASMGGTPSPDEVDLAIQACIGPKFLKRLRPGNLTAACEILSIVQRSSPKRHGHKGKDGGGGRSVLRLHITRLSDALSVCVKSPLMQGEALESAMRLHKSFCVPALQAYQSQEAFDPDAPEIDPEVSSFWRRESMPDTQYILREAASNILDVMVLSGAYEDAHDAFWAYKDGMRKKKDVPIRVPHKIARALLLSARYEDAKRILESQDDHTYGFAPVDMLSTAVVEATRRGDAEYAAKLHGALTMQIQRLEENIGAIEGGGMESHPNGGLPEGGGVRDIESLSGMTRRLKVAKQAAKIYSQDSLPSF